MPDWMRTRVLFVLIPIACLGISAIPTSAQTPAVPSDKIAWDMRQDTAGMTFEIAIDGSRSPLAGSTCGALADGVAACNAPLPAMTPGLHELRLIAVLVVNGQRVESAPSLPLSVTFIVVTTPENVRLIK